MQGAIPFSHARWRAPWWVFPDGFPRYLLCLNGWLMWSMFMWMLVICFLYNAKCCLNVWCYPVISRWMLESCQWIIHVYIGLCDYVLSHELSRRSVGMNQLRCTGCASFKVETKDKLHVMTCICARSRKIDPFGQPSYFLCWSPWLWAKGL